MNPILMMYQGLKKTFNWQRSMLKIFSVAYMECTPSTLFPMGGGGGNTHTKLMGVCHPFYGALVLLKLNYDYYCHGTFRVLSRKNMAEYDMFCFRIATS